MTETSPEVASAEDLPREVATEVTKCPQCGEQVGVQETRDDGSVVLDTHDHDHAAQRAAVEAPNPNAPAPGSEQASFGMVREQGTVVETGGDA